MPGEAHGQEGSGVQLMLFLSALEVTCGGRPCCVPSGSLRTANLGMQPWTIPHHIGVDSMNVVMELNGVSENEVIPLF